MFLATIFQAAMEINVVQKRRSKSFYTFLCKHTILAKGRGGRPVRPIQKKFFGKKLVVYVFKLI